VRTVFGGTIGCVIPAKAVPAFAGVTKIAVGRPASMLASQP